MLSLHTLTHNTILHMLSKKVFNTPINLLFITNKTNAHLLAHSPKNYTNPLMKQLKIALSSRSVIMLNMVLPFSFKVLSSLILSLQMSLPHARWCFPIVPSCWAENTNFLLITSIMALVVMHQSVVLVIPTLKFHCVSSIATFVYNVFSTPFFSCH